MMVFRIQELYQLRAAVKQRHFYSLFTIYTALNTDATQYFFNHM